MFLFKIWQIARPVFHASAASSKTRKKSAVDNYGHHTHPPFSPHARSKYFLDLHSKESNLISAGSCTLRSLIRRASCRTSSPWSLSPRSGSWNEKIIIFEKLQRSPTKNIKFTRLTRRCRFRCCLSLKRPLASGP